MTKHNEGILISVKDLKVSFHTEQGVVKAVRGVDFTIPVGGSLGVVGESGSGKSVTSRALMQLISKPAGRIESGEILYHKADGSEINITSQNPMGNVMRSLRGNEIAMIFQEPMTSLNPVYTIGEQIMESIILHQKKNKKEAKELAIQMLEKVGISSPRQRVDQYPHQFSGGMRQRAMIAMALSCNPHLLIADEPTTALDVTIEAQILELIKELHDEMDMGLLMITHDLGVIAETVDHVIVMYMGKIMEAASTEKLFNEPAHPYTRALMASIPKIGDGSRLNPIKGSVPSPYVELKGCPFVDRCSESFERCWNEEPPIFELDDGQQSRCWLCETKEQ